MTAAGIIAGAMIASSGFLNGCGDNAPPPDDPYSSEDNQLEDVYGPPVEFDEEENIPETVYGPPEDFYQKAESVTPAVTEAPEEFPEEENIIETVYGPPEALDLDNE